MNSLSLLIMFNCLWTQRHYSNFPIFSCPIRLEMSSQLIINAFNILNINNIRNFVRICYANENNMSSLYINSTLKLKIEFINT